MTSAVRTCNFRSGFTLIEIVMVLAIASILMGGAVAIMVFSTDEKDLRNASGEIELLAKRARTIAILQQTPYALEFRPGVVRLLPLAEAGQDETKTALGHTIGGERVYLVPAGAASPVHDQLTLDPQMTTFIRRWNTTEWLPMNEHIVHVWRFDPDGLCEPVSVRVNMGGNYIEDTYHPLTATIRDTVLDVK
ncbi:MAG: prepilin-type N-terminal cleavage/methylation domain-containing protein [Verrucomicrobia bacterium]|nr:prepilin-type N-terminal cleavage/methylation domain-containing protein [Verrucomicrobiota bacterium]